MNSQELKNVNERNNGGANDVEMLHTPHPVPLGSVSFFRINYFLVIVELQYVDFDQLST